MRSAISSQSLAGSELGHSQSFSAKNSQGWRSGVFSQLQTYKSPDTGPVLGIELTLGALACRLPMPRKFSIVLLAILCPVLGPRPSATMADIRRANTELRASIQERACRQGTSALHHEQRSEIGPCVCSLPGTLLSCIEPQSSCTPYNSESWGQTCAGSLNRTLRSS